MLNDEWHVAMYYYMRAISPYASIFWVILLSVATIIFMKLFLAIFLNNFL